MANPRTSTSSTDVKINEVVIHPSSGRGEDITSIVNVINIHEDLFLPVITGSVQLIDGRALPGTLSLHGNEFITISFNRPDDQGIDTKYTKSFRIYKIGERGQAGTTQAQSYIIYFCSEELVYSNQLLLSKTYKGGSCTDYVKKILTKDLKTNSNRIVDQNFEPSSGDAFHVLTKYKPFEAINHFANRSFNNNYSSFVFFENKDGFNFSSLERLFKRPTLNELSYNTSKFTNEIQNAVFKNSNDMNKFEIAQTFDILKNTRKGAYSSTHLTLDILTQQYRRNKYSVVDEKNKKIMMDGNFPFNDAKNRGGKALYEEYDSCMKYSITNLGQTNNPYFQSKVQRVLDTNIENTLIQRNMQLNLLQSTALECIVPGNPFYSVGYMLDFNMPAFSQNLNNERLIDPYYKGKYLITETRHMISGGKLQTMLRLSKNSVATAYDKASETEGFSKARRY